jgi:hypothetical protein
VLADDRRARHLADRSARVDRQADRLPAARALGEPQRELDVVVTHHASHVADEHAGLRKANHGTYPFLRQLTTTQHEQLDGTMAETLGALALLPGTLETTALPVVPKIPSAK